MIIDSLEMTVSLPQEKVESISKKYQDILSVQEVSIKDLAKLLGTLSSTSLAIHTAPLYMRYLRRQQIHNLCLKRDYNSKVALDPFCKEELNWWISNLRLSNRKSVISHQVKLLIQSDSSKTGDINRKSMVSSRTDTGLGAAKFAILTFCKYKKDIAVPVQMDNQAA